MLAAASLGACYLPLPGPSVSELLEGGTAGDYGFPADDTNSWVNSGPTAKEQRLAVSDFSVELIRFTDARRARSMEMESPDKRIYEYDPDTLLQGVSFQVPAIIEKYLCYRPRKTKHYKAEIELTRLNTVIKTGDTLSGSWGRYSVTMDLNVLVRRADDSSVIMKRSITLSEEQKRLDVGGRGPSKEMDRMRMYDLTEVMLRKAAERIGWYILDQDSRRWNTKPTDPLQPVDIHEATASPSFED